MQGGGGRGVSAYSGLAVKSLPGLREAWGGAAGEDGAHTGLHSLAAGRGQEKSSADPALEKMGSALGGVDGLRTALRLGEWTQGLM